VNEETPAALACVKLQAVFGPRSQREFLGEGEPEIWSQSGAGKGEEGSGRQAESGGAFLIPGLRMFLPNLAGRDSGYEVLVDAIAEDAQGKASCLGGLDQEERLFFGGDAEMGEEFSRERQK
jgi:hypothetical protein